MSVDATSVPGAGHTGCHWPAAWLATAGYAMVLFTLIGVNLLMSGLHSYAGG